MAGGRILLDGFEPVIDASGNAIAGATLHVYLNGTTTLASIFQDPELTIAATNPQTSTAAGYFRAQTTAIYADMGSSYTLRLTYPSGTIVTRNDVTLSEALEVSAYSAGLLDLTGAEAWRQELDAAKLDTAVPVEATRRKRWYQTVWFNPLATIPTNLGVGEPPALQNADGVQALNEAWLRSHVQMLVNDLGLERIVIGQLEFGGYHWLMPPTGQSWPDRLPPATGKPVWYWTLVGGDKSAYIDIDQVDIIMDEAEKLGASVVVGTSRFDDIELLNDDANCRIGLRPTSTLTLSSTAVGTRTITASVGTFLSSYVGRNIVPETGNGYAVITGFTSATEVTVNVTTAFDSATLTSDNWRLRLPDPMRYGLTLAARMTRAVDATRQLASWVVARWGNNKAFRGFYSAHEPDSLECTGEFFGRCWTGAGTYPALSTYNTVDGHRIEWWMAPASPVDNFYNNVARVRAALITAGVSHLAEQDSVGPGTNRITGVYAWIPGQPTTLDQLYASHVAYRNLLRGTGIEFVGHAEVWEMAGPSYDKPYPAAPSRLADQWRWGQALTQSSSLYQSCGYIARPTDTLQPPMATSGSGTFRARAHALYEGLRDAYRDRVRKANAFPSIEVARLSGRQTWGSIGGVVVTNLPSYTPQAAASELVIRVEIKLNRTGSAGAATGYVDCSLVVNGTEGPRTRAMQDDDRADCVSLVTFARAIGNDVTLAIRLDNQLIAATVADIVATWEVQEMLG